MEEEFSAVGDVMLMVSCFAGSDVTILCLSVGLTVNSETVAVLSCVSCRKSDTAVILLITFFVSEVNSVTERASCFFM